MSCVALLLASNAASIALRRKSACLTPLAKQVSWTASSVAVETRIIRVRGYFLTVGYRRSLLMRWVACNLLAVVDMDRTTDLVRNHTTQRLDSLIRRSAGKRLTLEALTNA